MDLTSIIKQLYHYSSYRRLYSYLKNITEYHRIQGSSGLLAASDYIVSVLNELGADHEIIRIDKNTDLGLFKIPVGWDVFDAELWITKPYHKRLLKLDDHPTMVLAHSPPTDGWIENELVYVGQGVKQSDYDGKDISGKIVLAHGTPYYVYKEASKRNAAGIIYYKQRIPENAVPYAGLFLTIDEAKRARTIGLSISNKIARQLIKYLEKKEKVILKIRIDAKYNFNPILPVVVARYNGQRREGYALVAHLCHPKPGAHDNGSGVAALLEAATILSMMSKKHDDKLPSLYYTIYLIWAPEYLGTQGLFAKKRELPRIIRAAINLDMIGAKPEITGSVLHHINSSISKPSYLDAILEKSLHIILSSPSTYTSLNKSISIRYDNGPYEGGSDHDVFIAYGVPASMLNQWPDKFYHTDMDDVENIDPLLLTKISVAALGAIYFVSSINNTKEYNDKLRYLLHTITDYYNMMINKRLLLINEKEIKIREMIKNTLVSLLANAFDDILQHFGFQEALEFKKNFVSNTRNVKGIEKQKSYISYPKKLFHGILSTRHFYDEYRDKVLELIGLVEKNNKYTTVLFREALHLANGKRSIDDIYNILIAEYGLDSVDKSDLEKFFKILESLGLVYLK